jgi:hypothetical protein
MAKCEYLGRLVSSYRFSGFVCNAQNLPHRMGDLHNWDKEARKKNMERFGCYTDNCNCPFIKQKEN